MADITVTKVLENQLMKFKVVVSEEKSQTEHLVTLNRADYQRTTDGDVQPERLIEEAFEFLLENEPKEDILSQFDYTMIDRYFPHFHREIQKRLKQI
jgi:hypothetical protein